MRDGKQFASAYSVGIVRIWDTKAWTPLHSLETAQRPVSLLEWSPDGKLLAAARGSLIVNRCRDRMVRFWEPSTGTLLEEGDSLVAVTTTGDVKFDPDVSPGLIAIVETPAGQQTMTLDEFATKHGCKNRGKMMRLPSKH